MRCSNPQRAFRRRNGAEFAYTHACGQCMPCRIRRRDEWTLRILLESQNQETAFSTLTYSDEYLPEKQSLCVEDVQLWLKRLRRHQGKSRAGRTRYFVCGEYGSLTDRPHYHAVLFGDQAFDENDIQDSWGMGNTVTTPLTVGRARYVAKYTTKSSYVPPGYFDGRKKEFAVMSRKPGIGLIGTQAIVKALRNAQLCVLYGRSEGKKGKTTLSTLPACIRIGKHSYPIPRAIKKDIASAMDGVESGSVREALLAHERLAIEPTHEELVQAAADARTVARAVARMKKRELETAQL